MNNKLITNIIRQLQDVINQENWLDENFYKKIDELSAENAFKRPLPNLHSVAEIISHLLVWRKVSIKKLKGEMIEFSMDNPNNWRTNDELSIIGWDNLKTEFYHSQEELIQLLQMETDEYLDNLYYDGCKYKYLVEGLLHHDLYHLGQIGITIKFLKSEN